MVEMKYDEKNADFKLPKNIRQVGQSEGDTRIYVEDYVVTFLNERAKEAPSEEKLAILLGNTVAKDDQIYIFIHGAVAVEHINIQDDHIGFTSGIWTGIYEDIEKYFGQAKVAGWFLTRPGKPLKVTEQITKTHTDNFPGDGKLLMMLEPVDCEEQFYIYRHGALEMLKGYYIYYERNEAMQSYMIDYRQKNEKTDLMSQVIEEMLEDNPKTQDKKRGKARTFVGVSAASKSDANKKKAAEHIVGNGKSENDMTADSSISLDKDSKDSEKDLSAAFSQAGDKDLGADGKSTLKSRLQGDWQSRLSSEKGIGNRDKKVSDSEQLEKQTKRISKMTRYAAVFAFLIIAASAAAVMKRYEVRQNQQAISTGISDETNTSVNEDESYVSVWTTSEDKINSNDNTLSQNNDISTADVDNSSTDINNSGGQTSIDDTNTVDNTNVSENQNTENPNSNTGETDEQSMDASEVKDVVTTALHGMKYTVKEGDTLAEISEHYYASIAYVNAICVLNDIDNADKIYPGMEITLP